jgi:hypothetical protein
MFCGPAACGCVTRMVVEYSVAVRQSVRCLRVFWATMQCLCGDVCDGERHRLPGACADNTPRELRSTPAQLVQWRRQKALVDTRNVCVMASVAASSCQ